MGRRVIARIGEGRAIRVRADDRLAVFGNLVGSTTAVRNRLFQRAKRAFVGADLIGRSLRVGKFRGTARAETLRAVPHVVLRENKLATGAGADRVSSGMRLAFGKNVGTAARLECNQAIMTVSCTPAAFNTAKLALWKASMKYPTPCYIDVEKGKEFVN